MCLAICVTCSPSRFAFLSVRISQIDSFKFINDFPVYCFISENQNYKVLSDILILIYFGQLLSNPFQALVFLVSCAPGRSIAQLFCNIIPAFMFLETLHSAKKTSVAKKNIVPEKPDIP